MSVPVSVDEPRFGQWLSVAVLLGVFLGVGGVAASSSLEMRGVVLVGLGNTLLAVSLSIFAGNSGVLSFGHMGLAAVGGYTTSILVTPEATKKILLPDMPSTLAGLNASPVCAVLISGAVAVAVAAFFGVAILRLSGLAASIATLALLLIVNVVASNWQQVTGGVAGTGGIPITTDFAQLAVWLVVATVAALAFKTSSWGLMLRASREDEIAARSIGISIYRERFFAWLLSAFFAGVAGSLIAQLLGSFSPNSFFIPLTFSIVAMLVVGGLTTVSGALIGSLVITVTLEVLRRIEVDGIQVGALDIPGRTGITETGLAVILLLCLKFRPEGISGGREFSLAGLRDSVSRLGRKRERVET